VTLVIKKKTFLNGRSKDEFITQLTNFFNQHVEKAYIFGSFYTELFNTDSDLDILLIAQTQLKFHDRYQLFPELLQFLQSENVLYDLLIYTPEEFKKLQDEGLQSKVGFWKNFNRESKLIFCKI